MFPTVIELIFFTGVVSVNLWAHSKDRYTNFLFFLLISFFCFDKVHGYVCESSFFSRIFHFKTNVNVMLVILLLNKFRLSHWGHQVQWLFQTTSHHGQFMDFFSSTKIFVITSNVILVCTQIWLDMRVYL